jgi:hypothetical protein
MQAATLRSAEREALPRPACAPAHLRAAMTLVELVRQLGRKYGRSDDEVELLVKGLEEHWITTPAQWKAMSPALRRKVRCTSSAIPRHLC